MKHELTPLARAMRNQPTDAERRLWHILRARPGGFKFRRQFPIGRYIVDFACYQARLVVEVDGKFHADQEADVERDAWFQRRAGISRGTGMMTCAPMPRGCWRTSSRDLRS